MSRSDVEEYKVTRAAREKRTRQLREAQERAEQAERDAHIATQRQLKAEFLERQARRAA